MDQISWEDFQKIDIRCGTICEIMAFPQARKPAYILRIDFGEDIGIRKSSAQITQHYSKAALIGKKVIAVVNFPPRQIGPHLSEVLVLGFDHPEGGISLIGPDHLELKNGIRLY